MITEVVCGKAPGVDTLGEQWGNTHGIHVEPFPAKWRVNGVYNRAAGIQRNHKMGDYADAAVCVWDGVSPGTKDMIAYMKQLKKPCFVLRTDIVDIFEFGTS